MAHEQFNQVLAALREQFFAQLPEKMNAIAQQASCIDLMTPSHVELAALHRLIHNLTGAAGTFGLCSLSEEARQAERLLDHLCNTKDKHELQATGEALAAALQRLQRLACSIPDPTSPILTPSTAQLRPKAKLSPLIYLIEDDSQQGQNLSLVLEKAGYRPRLLDGLSAFSAALQEEEPPAAIVMDMVFPDGDLAGATYIQQQRQKYFGNFPPVIFVSVRHDLDARLAAYRSGAAHYLNKPVSSERLLRLLDDITHRVPSEPYRVLMVDDEPLILEAQASMLRAAGMKVSTLRDPRQIVEQMQVLDPEVLVLDFHMPDISGPELAALLREDECYSQLPIVFLSAEPDPYCQSQALSLGGDDFLQKPVAPQYLISRVSARARRAREQRANRSELQQLLYEREREHLALNQHAIVSVANQSGNITYVNDLFCDISGYSRSELLGKNHRLLKSGKHADSYYQEIWATIVSGQTWFGEICNRRKDGSFYWVESSITPFLDETGKPYQYVSIRTDISHVKAVEQELARLSQVASQTTNGVVITDTEGRVEWINDGFTRISGYSFDDMCGRKPGELLQGPETDPGTVAMIRAAMARGEGFKADLINYTKEHKSYWIRIQCNPLHDDKGALQGFMAIESDVTQEKDDADQLAATLESTNDGILAVDDSGQVLFMNLQFRQMWHLPDHLVRESNDEKLLAHAVTHLLDPQGFMKKVNALYQSTEESDDLIKLLDGRIFERHSKPLHRERKAAGRVWSFHDITERLSAEQAAEAAKERLRRGQLYANIGTWEWNIVTGELFWTERIAPLFGYSAGDLETSYDNFLGAVHPDDRQAVIDAVAACVEHDVPYDIEHRVVWPDGTERWLLERGAVKRDVEGKPLVMIGVVQDINDRKQAEQGLIAAREDADRANQAKTEFLSSMSHELRTPMNAILGFGQLMEYDDSLPEEHLDSVTEILKAGNHLLELINEVLDLAKVESGMIELSLEPIDICPVVEECLSLLSTLADKRNIQITYSGLEDAVVRADRTRLKQVLLNLLSNAIKYNHEGGRVRLEVQPKDSDRLLIGVIDTGKGIPADKLAELFQPFNRLGAEAGEIEGTGIGLTITRRIVEMMGGSVNVQSEVGIGSCFWIELPLEQTLNATGMQKNTSLKSSETDRGETTIHTVLYIEDNPANLKLVTQILGHVPHVQLLTAHTPSLGIELALARHPALILLDINMPAMDGYQVLKVFQAEASLKAIPVIAITANAMPRDIQRGMAAGFVDYLTKPLNVEQFLATVRHYLDGDRA